MFSLVHYLKFFCLTILLSGPVYAGPLAFESVTWKRLLGFEKNKFTAQYDWFYLSDKAKNSLEDEWLASIAAIKNQKLVGREKRLFSCAFPARYSYIQKYYPQFKNQSCPEFEEWAKDIGAKEVYIVYTASYVSNPASMFGHTFLRLSRGNNSRAFALTDYSVGFLAQTDPSDDPLSYTVKGVSGQYIGYYEIKPFYMNVGLYQNSEDRDLWQYKLKISDAQLEFLVKHLWELSLNTGFKYYFFDENCSTAILKLIQSTNEDLDFFSDHNFIFAHPIETLKWAKDYLELDNKHYYASTNKILRARLSKLNASQKVRYLRLRDSDEELSQASADELDALIDHWKFKNYKANANLNEVDRKRFEQVLKFRASLGGPSEPVVIDPVENESPILFHDPNSLNLAQLYNHKTQKWEQELQFKLGYHGILDRSIGHDSYSYIDYFNFKARRIDSKFKFTDVNFFEILSLSPYMNELKTFSWNLGASYDKVSNYSLESVFKTKSSIGISFITKQATYFSLVGLESLFHSNDIRLIPYLELGHKRKFENGLFFMSLKPLLFKDKLEWQGQVAPVFYLNQSTDLRIISSYSKGLFEEIKSKIEIGFYY